MDPNDILDTSISNLAQPRILNYTSAATQNVPIAQLNQSFQTFAKYYDDAIKRAFVDLQYPQEKELSMLSTIMKMYSMGTQQDEYGVVPHIVGPAGCGKSSTIKEAGRLLEVNVHTLNVSRVNPLQLGGVSIPNADNTALNLLHSPFWKNLQEGDIVLLDEFLRGFPEVYNAMLDVMTSHEVDGLVLPDNVFFIAASNSVRTYDPALEDRLLHLPVADPRKKARERERLQSMFANNLGLHPEMALSQEMSVLFQKVVLPTFELLDVFKGNAVNMQAAKSTGGKSIRNLSGQVRLRELQTPELKTLIGANNAAALKDGTLQHLIIQPDGKISGTVKDDLVKLKENKTVLKKLSPLQVRNLDLNLEMLMLQDTLKETKEENSDDIFITDIF